MNLAGSSRLSLDGYRIQVVERLKTCTHADQSKDVIAEVNALLAGTGLSNNAHRAFWEGLYTDLEVVEEESTRLLRLEAAAGLAAVIAAAQAEIMKYVKRISS
jgi:hypothetical protein